MLRQNPGACQAAFAHMKERYVDSMHLRKHFVILEEPCVLGDVAV